MKAYEQITERDIARWNAAAESRHGHNNKRVLDGLSRTLVVESGNHVEEGTASNQMPVWDAVDLIYKPKTVHEIRQIMNLKGTNTEMEALALTLGVNDMGLWFYNSTHQASYQWNGSSFQ